MSDRIRIPAYHASEHDRNDDAPMSTACPPGSNAACPTDSTAACSKDSTAARPSESNVACSHGSNAACPSDSNPSSLPPAKEPSLDVESARRVLEETYLETLAPYALSSRETNVALLMLDGLTIASAAEKLGVSAATVKFHLGNIYRKLDVQSKAGLIRLTKDDEKRRSENRP